MVGAWGPYLGVWWNWQYLENWTNWNLRIKQLFGFVHIVKMNWTLILYSISVSCSVMSDCLWPHRLCSPNTLFVVFSGRLSGVHSYSLLQGILLTQGSNMGLLHCRQILYHLSHQGNPVFYKEEIKLISGTSRVNMAWKADGQGPGTQRLHTCCSHFIFFLSTFPSTSNLQKAKGTSWSAVWLLWEHHALQKRNGGYQDPQWLIGHWPMCLKSALTLKF